MMKPLLQFCLIALTCVLFVGAVNPAAQHYLQDALLDGKMLQRWNDQTPIIYVRLQPGPTQAGWTNRHNQVVKEAFTAWQTALNNKVKFAYTSDLKQTDIDIKWHTQGDGMKIGEQKIRFSNNVIADADINLDLVGPTGQIHTLPQVKYIAMHEIGHALGIRGHSSNPNDIMYYSMQNRAPSLSSRDILTIRALYLRPPNITNPKNVHLLQYRQYEYYDRLGRDAYNRKDFASALDYFQKARSYYPSDKLVSLPMGMSALQLKKYEIAIPELEKAVALGGKSKTQAQILLAKALSLQAANAIQNGKSAGAGQNLAKAQTQYQNVLQDPASPQQAKQSAMAGLSEIKKVSSFLR